MPQKSLSPKARTDSFIAASESEDIIIDTGHPIVEHPVPQVSEFAQFSSPAAIALVI